jgi:hypothetical protein
MPRVRKAMGRDVMQEDEDRHQSWSLWAAIAIVAALKDAGLVAAPQEDKAVAVAKDRLFDLLTEPERWARAFPGDPGGA